MATQRKKGAIIGYANILVKNIVNLAYTPMLLAFIGQDEFGVYQTAYQFIFSIQLLSFGFSVAYVRFYTLRKVKDDEAGIHCLNGMYLKLYLVICSLAIAVGFLMVAASGFLFKESFSSSEIKLVQVLMMIMTFNTAAILMSTVFDAYIISHEQFAFQQSRQMLATLLTPLLALVLLFVGMGAVGVALAQLVANIVLLLLNVVFAIRRLGMKFDFRNRDKTLFGALVAFSTWIFANQLTDLITLNFPSVVLGAISGAGAVAVFSIAMQFRALFYSVSTTLSNVFIPKVNRIVAESDDNKELTLLMARVGRYQAILYCWVLGGFVILGKWFVCVWAGEAFVDAYWITLVIAIPLVVPLVQNVGIEIQKARNQHRARSIVYFVTSLVNLAVTFILAPRFGYWAPAIGFAVYIIAATWFFMNWYYQARIQLDMFYFWKRVSPVLVSGCVVVVLGLIGEHYVPVCSLSAFMGWGIVYSILYGAVIWRTGLVKDERRAIIGRIAALKGK